MNKGAIATCDDCYFGKAGLCALRTGVICPTFRLAARTGALAPPRQATLVARPAFSGRVVAAA